MDTSTDMLRKVWLNEQARIASFHPVEGYREQIIPCRESFVELVHSLQEQGFRFQ